MKRFFSVLAAILSCAILLCSCGNQESLVGKWVQIDGEGVLVFTDKSVVANGVEYMETDVEYSYRQSNGALTLIATEEKELTYELEEGMLTITYDGASASYVRESEDADKATSVDVGNDASDDSEQKEPADDEIKASIVGIWETEYKGSKLVYQFNEDGTGMASIIPMTYTVENGVITITASAFGKTETGSAAYSVADDTLVLEKDGDSVIMKKTTMEELENE